uniref:Uncharacterized protein n=1 Tax=Trichogramma kaykai TaxID=54128 RepID=A0ABD2WU65_9HYME
MYQSKKYTSYYTGRFTKDTNRSNQPTDYRKSWQSLTHNQRRKKRGWKNLHPREPMTQQPMIQEARLWTAEDQLSFTRTIKQNQRTLMANALHYSPERLLDMGYLRIDLLKSHELKLGMIIETGLLNGHKLALEKYEITSIRIAQHDNRIKSSLWPLIENYLRTNLRGTVAITLCAGFIDTLEAEDQLRIIQESHDSALGGSDPDTYLGLHAWTPLKFVQDPVPKQILKWPPISVLIMWVLFMRRVPEISELQHMVEKATGYKITAECIEMGLVPLNHT